MTAAELAEVFRTEERVRILRHVAEQGPVTATAIVRAEGVSKALVSRYLRRLEDGGYLVRQGRAFVWLDHARGRSVKRLLTADRLAPVLRLPVWARGIGIYGSYAEGTNTLGSDLDVWVLVEEYAPDLEVSAARTEREIERETGVETNLLLLTAERLEELRQTDEPFYRNFISSNITFGGVAIGVD